MVPIIGDGRSRFQPVPVENVATAFVSALAKEDSIGQTYDLTGPEVLTMNKIVTLVLAATGRKRLRIHLPIWLARAQAALLEFVFAKVLRKAPPLNRDQIQMLQEDNVGDPDPANRLFGLATSPVRGEHQKLPETVRRWMSEQDITDRARLRFRGRSHQTSDLNPVGLDLVVERLAPDAEALGGFEFVAAGFLEHLHDRVALHAFQQGEIRIQRLVGFHLHVA